MANGLILFFLLGLVLVSRAESRTIPTLPDSHYPNASSSSSSNMPSKSSSSLGGDRLEDEECKGLQDEECLIKRSMVAHTDYIYTQDISSAGP